MAAAADIAVEDALEWIDRDRPLVADLRSPFAYAALHIEGSLNIVDELCGELVRGGLPFGKIRPVLPACPVGEQSARYAALPGRMGHSDVRGLRGGIGPAPSTPATSASSASATDSWSAPTATANAAQVRSRSRCG